MSAENPFENQARFQTFDGAKYGAGGRRRSSFFDETMKPRKSLALSPEERTLLNEGFAKIVGGRAGVATLQELGLLLDHINEPCSPSARQGFFDRADTNGDGVLDFDEVVTHLEKRKLQHAATGALADSELLHTFVAFGGNPDATGCANVTGISTVLKEFELDYSVDQLLPEPVLPAALDAKSDSIDPDSVPDQAQAEPSNLIPESGLIDFHTFRKIFGQLLTQRHFRAPSFADV